MRSFFSQKTALLIIVFLSINQLLQAQDKAPDYEENSWQTLTGSEQPKERHENAYVKVEDRFYLIGGRGERPVEIYDPATGQWTEGATPPLSMHHFQAVAHDGKIYVLGAFNGNFPDETPIGNVYIYHPDSDQWEKGPEIPEQRRRGAAGVVTYKDRIYVAGGIQNGHIDGQVRWFDVFNPQTGEWKALADAPRRRDHFQAAVIDDKLYLAGGRRSSHATGKVLELTIPEVDVYDFSTGKWTPLPPSGDLPTERAGTSAVSVGKHLVVLGGESGSQVEAHAEVEIYDIVTGTWSTLPPLNTGRHGTQAVFYDGKLFIAAGSKTRGATEINTQEVFTFADSLLR